MFSKAVTLPLSQESDVKVNVSETPCSQRTHSPSVFRNLYLLERINKVTDSYSSFKALIRCHLLIETLLDSVFQGMPLPQPTSVIAPCSS